MMDSIDMLPDKTVAPTAPQDSRLFEKSKIFLDIFLFPWFTYFISVGIYSMYLNKRYPQLPREKYTAQI